MPRNSPDPEQYVLVGKVTKAHGIKGEVKVLPYSGHPEDFRLFKEVLLVNPENETTQFHEISSSGGKGKFAIVGFAHIDNRNKAEALAGLEAWVRKQDLPALEADEFYWHEMVGLLVQTIDGIKLGSVTALFSTGAHDVLVVTGTGKEYYIPAKEKFFVRITEDQKTLIVDPPPGLLEIND